MVNTTLHGWDMIDAEHYFRWVDQRSKNIEEKKAAALLCSYAINDLLNKGAEIVTLGACGHFAFLSERLGFKRCFNNTIMKFGF